MTKRKRKAPIPMLHLWSKGEQRRFCDAIETIVSVARDLADLVKQLRDERAAKQRRYERRRAKRCPEEAATVSAAADETLFNADGTSSGDPFA